MKITYKEHYEKLISSHGEEKGLILYKKFLRSSKIETYIIKFGEEEGKRRYKNKKKPGTSLQKMIEKYGEKEGIRRFERWKSLTNQSEKSFKKRYGEKEGEKKYNEFKLKCVIKEHIKNDKDSGYNNRKHSTKIEYYLKECGGDYEKAKKMLRNRQNTSSLDKFIIKYGEKEGRKKYKDVNVKKSITLDNFIRLYGEIDGTERWENYKNKLRYSHTENYYIGKYGKLDGKIKYKKMIEKRCSYLNGRSKISDEFCYKLYNKIGIKKEVYFSENEWMFFINSDDYKMLSVDFYLKNYNIIVEFYGDYWHKNPLIYEDINIWEKDRKRIEKLQNIGNDVIIVWENEYKNDKNKTILRIYEIIQKKIEKRNGES